VLARGPSAADRTFDYLISSPPPPATRRLLWHPSIIQTHATDTQQKKKRKVERNEKIKRKEKERKKAFVIVSLSRLRAYRACCFVIVVGQN
jgi:hypothetical protein